MKKVMAKPAILLVVKTPSRRELQAQAFDSARVGPLETRITVVCEGVKLTATMKSACLHFYDSGACLVYEGWLELEDGRALSACKLNLWPELGQGEIV